MPTTHKQTVPSSTPASASVFTLRGAALDRYWTRVVPHIEDALARAGEFTLDEVRQRVESDEAQCWCAAVDGEIVASCITAVRTDLNGKYCDLWLCGGTALPLWMKFLYLEIEPWAKRSGCERMRLNGRPGWLRKLNGYRVRSVTLEKSLNGQSCH